MQSSTTAPPTVSLDGGILSVSVGSLDHYVLCRIEDIPSSMDRIRVHLSVFCRRYDQGYVREGFVSLCGRGAWNRWRTRIQDVAAFDIGPAPDYQDICLPYYFEGLPRSVPYPADMLLRKGTVLTNDELLSYTQKYRTRIPVSIPSKNNPSAAYEPTMPIVGLRFRKLGTHNYGISDTVAASPTDVFSVVDDVHLSTTRCCDFTPYEDNNFWDNDADYWAIVENDTVFCAPSVIELIQTNSSKTCRFVPFFSLAPRILLNVPIVMPGEDMQKALDVLYFSDSKRSARLVHQKELKSHLLARALSL